MLDRGGGIRDARRRTLSYLRSEGERTADRLRGRTMSAFWLGSTGIIFPTQEEGTVDPDGGRKERGFPKRFVPDRGRDCQEASLLDGPCRPTRGREGPTMYLLGRSAEVACIPQILSETDRLVRTGQRVARFDGGWRRDCVEALGPVHQQSSSWKHVNFGTAPILSRATTASRRLSRSSIS